MECSGVHMMRLSGERPDAPASICSTATTGWEVRRRSRTCRIRMACDAASIPAQSPQHSPDGVDHVGHGQADHFNGQETAASMEEGGVTTFGE